MSSAPWPWVPNACGSSNDDSRCLVILRIEAGHRILAEFALTIFPTSPLTLMFVNSCLV